MGYIYYDDWYDDFLAHAEVTRTDDMKYGLPEQKKYPMPDRKHVMSAIKFFNYVSPKDEETLAHAILARMKEYGIDEVNVGPDNRFGKYYKPDTLAHHQIKGAKHGIRRWQNEDGSWTPAGRLRYGKGGKPRGRQHHSVKKIDMEGDWRAKVKELGKEDAYNWLQNRIEKESGDWYNGNPISDGFKRAMEEHDKKYAELKKKHNTYQYVEEMFNYRDAKFMRLTEKYWEPDERYAGGFILKKEYRKGSKGAAEADRAIDKAFDQIEKDPKYKALKAKHDEAIKAFEKERRQLDDEYEKRLVSVVLDDLGYKDTEAARKRVRDVIFWD